MMRAIPALLTLALAACGAAPTELARSGLDADEAPPQVVKVRPQLQAATVLSTSITPPSALTRTFANVGDKGVDGSDVLVGTFLLGCGIGLQHGPFAAEVDDGEFSVVVNDSAQNMMLIGAFVDVNGNGAFDTDVDAVFSAGGYDALDADDGVELTLLEPSEGDWLRDLIPELLLQATTTTEE